MNQRTGHGAPELLETCIRNSGGCCRVHGRGAGRPAGAAGAGEWQHAVSQSGRSSRRHHQRGSSPAQARAGALGSRPLASPALGLASPSLGLASPPLGLAPSLASSPLAPLVTPAPGLKKGTAIAIPFWFGPLNKIGRAGK